MLKSPYPLIGDRPVQSSRITARKIGAAVAHTTAYAAKGIPFGPQQVFLGAPISLTTSSSSTGRISEVIFFVYENR